MKIISFQLILIICFVLCLTNNCVISWSNHNISSLRLLQIVHRHGDRAITKIYPKDPFKELSKYWPEGLGELSTLGKYNMYKLGQFIRNEYHEYLESEYSPREVYARSSAKSRCLESIYSLLAGVYPPDNKKWKWNQTEEKLGFYWQPIPVFTVPAEHMNDDKLLRTEAFCPKVTEEMNKLEKSDFVQNIIQKETQFLKNLSEIMEIQTITTTLGAKNVYDHLITEYERGYKWSNFSIWTEEYEETIFQKLLPLTELLWISEWNSTVVQRLRAGPLIQELNNNLNNYINSVDNSKKLYLYSTHDAMVAVLLHSLQVFDNKIIPLSASLFFELHQKEDKNYFIRVYYRNESDKSPHLLRLPKCDSNDCPVDQFFKLSEELIPEDWDKECGSHSNTIRSLIISTSKK